MPPKNYDLKVSRSTLTTTGSRLTELSPVTPGDPSLGLITTIARTTPPTRIGDASANAATVYLSPNTISTIHNRVNDNNGSLHVTVQFTVSGSSLTDFQHSYGN